jgi:hypothetical protein
LALVDTASPRRDLNISLLGPGAWLGLILGTLLMLSCSTEPFYLGGIQVNEPDHERWVESLETAGMNTVSVTVFAHQGAWNTDHLWFDIYDTQWVRHEIRQAKKAGLHVVLILRVALNHTYAQNNHLWHGMIMPGTETQVRTWFMRYTQFVTEWAEVAAEEGVEVLGIGSEMNALASTLPIAAMPQLEEYYLDPEKQQEFKLDVLAGIAAGASLAGDAGRYPSVDAYLDDKVRTYESWAQAMTAGGEGDYLAVINQRRALLEECWLWLIDKVRAVYDGKLTYAANFDQYQEVGFWRHLDLIGINAYFPLRKTFLDGPERPQLPTLLEEGWRTVLGEVEAFRQAEGVAEMPVIFSELGYTERRDSTLAPWAGESFTVAWGERLPGAGESVPPAEEKRLIVWNQQPLEPRERTAAVAALRRVSQAEFPRLLTGILYWKLSTLAKHREIEPFVAILAGDDPDSRPLIEELAKFRHPED